LWVLGDWHNLINHKFGAGSRFVIYLSHCWFLPNWCMW
jgi:hypothetical protein